MKVKDRINNVIEMLYLNAFQLHILTVMIAKYAKQTGDLEPATKLIRETADDKEVIEWFHSYTPIRFNPKKKKFVNRNAAKWDNHAGLSSTIFVNTERLAQFKERFNTRTVEDLEKTFKSVSITISRLEVNNIDTHRLITDEDIGQLPILSEREMIKKYLSNNPAPAEMGRLGIPQSKYRYGTYGSPTYNEWGR